ncbi:ankyrin repeat domain-containing protein [Aquimarina macrocephali]|uniref:ankyrin repeat domain-containing protein n=1 Tax=Aquimarina macrocephali TaxID=666563 RepID=UPI00046682DA|nr:ankyrin repeat domain-containing protein [Aquimarina macrocephali]
MFWKNNLKLPITSEDKKWVEESIAFLDDKLKGREAKMETVLPTHPYFSKKFEGTLSDAKFVLNQVIQLMGIEDISIQLKLFNDGAVKMEDGSILTTPADINGRWKGAAGMYQNLNDVTTIFIATDQLNNLETLVATLAHELSHQLLLGEQWIKDNDEYLTDLLAIVCGFGIFIGNSKFNFSSEQIGIGSNWKMSEQGYLPEQVIAYAMAYLSIKRGESIDYAKFLNKTIAKYFKQSIKYLKKNGVTDSVSNSVKEIETSQEVIKTSTEHKEDFLEETQQETPENAKEFKIDTIEGIEKVSLVEACAQEDILLVKHLLQIGVDVNTTSKLGFSALNMAVIKNNIKLIHILLDAGADINLQNTDVFGLGETPLISAVKENNATVIELILDHGANPNTPNYFHKTPLMIAAQENALEAAKVLLEHKVPIEHGTHTGLYTETSLCIAVLNNHTEMVTLLVQNRAKTKPLRKLPRHKINPKMVKWLKQRKYL